MAAFCATCGTQSTPGENFCRSCGTRTAPQGASPANPPEPMYGAPAAGPYEPSQGHQPPSNPPPPYQPPGYQQPPPYQQASGYQQPPPYQQPSGYPPPPNQTPFGQLASWGPRALGILIDAGLLLALYLPFLILSVALHFFTILGDLAVIGGSIYLAVLVGQYGQSPGMRVIGLKCVSQTTGQPIGPGLGIVRALAHIVDSIICDVGYLFPLWDQQRQTLADKIMSTVVVVVPKQPFSLTPQS
jgi:uncharacterized RDD family membrane protein YckC